MTLQIKKGQLHETDSDQIGFISRTYDDRSDEEKQEQAAKTKAERIEIEKRTEQMEWDHKKVRFLYKAKYVGYGAIPCIIIIAILCGIFFAGGYASRNGF